MLKALLVSYWNLKSNLFLGARISKWRILNCCTKKCEILPSNTASLEFYHISLIFHEIPPNPPKVEFLKFSVVII